MSSSDALAGSWINPRQGKALITPLGTLGLPNDLPDRKGGEFPRKSKDGRGRLGHERSSDAVNGNVGGGGASREGEVR